MIVVVVQIRPPEFQLVMSRTLPEPLHATEMQKMSNLKFIDRDAFEKVLVSIMFVLLLADADGCSKNPCKHDGKCVTSFAAPGYKCQCADGFSGPHCERSTWTFGCDVARVGVLRTKRSTTAGSTLGYVIDT